MGVQEINAICLIGAGNMGHQIALSAALAGFKVKCTDVNQEVLQKAEQFASAYFPERVAKGKLKQAEADAARANIMFTADLAEAANDADLVIEAVSEKLELKRQLFAQLDKVCNMHFFNPALVMKLVEVVKGPHVAEKTTELLMDVCIRMGKTPVEKFIKKEWGRKTGKGFYDYPEK